MASFTCDYRKNTKHLHHCGAKCMHLICILMHCAVFWCKNASVPLPPCYLFDVSFMCLSYWWLRPRVPAVPILLLSDRTQISRLVILAEGLVFYRFPQASTSRRPTQKTQKLYSARYTHPLTLWLSHSAMCKYSVRTFSTLTFDLIDLIYLFVTAKVSSLKTFNSCFFPINICLICTSASRFSEYISTLHFFPEALLLLNK